MTSQPWPSFGILREMRLDARDQARDRAVLRVAVMRARQRLARQLGEPKREVEHGGAERDQPPMPRPPLRRRRSLRRRVGHAAGAAVTRIGRSDQSARDFDARGFRFRRRDRCPRRGRVRSRRAGRDRPQHRSSACLISAVRGSAATARRKPPRPSSAPERPRASWSEPAATLGKRVTSRGDGARNSDIALIAATCCGGRQRADLPINQRYDTQVDTRPHQLTGVQVPSGLRQAAPRAVCGRPSI